ncbi:hypothetical protein ACHAWF_007015 [Thalassiosira exigua]
MMILKRASTAALGLAASISSLAAESKTVEYTFTLRPRRSSAKDPSLSPDCYLDRLMMLVNDEFPGPTFKADVGDVARVTVVNESPTDTLALHFHGLTMRGFPYMDGTASLSQCSLGPRQTQVYEFDVLDAGTHYWHGHVSMERTDGFQGPLIVSNPDNEDEKELEAQYDGDVTVFLQDWYHLDGSMRRTGLDSNPLIWIGNAQSFLINGGGIFSPCLGDSTDGLSCASDCSADNYIKTIDVEEGKTYRLRIISGVELIGVSFAIKGHKMTVVEVEGTIVEPYEIESLDIMPAQRYSVLITADQEPGNYWATTSVRYRSTAPTGYINIKYAGTPQSNLTLDGGDFPTHPIWNDTEPTVELESNLFTKNPSSYNDADVLTADPSTIRRIVAVGTQAKDSETGLLRWAMNNVTMTLSDKPLILSAYEAVHAEGASAWPDTEVPGTVLVPEQPPTPWDYTKPVQDSVGEYNGNRGPSYIPLTEGEVVEVVMQNARALNGVPEMHSWHLHGHSFYVVGFGFGTFDEATDPAYYNLENPVRRDTVALLPLGWTAIRFKADNPGAWAFHCTQPSHAIMGMGFNFITSPDKLESPPAAARSCLENSLSEPGAKGATERSYPKVSAFSAAVRGRRFQGL